MKIKLSYSEFQSILNYIDKLPDNLHIERSEKYIYLIGSNEEMELVLDILSAKLALEGIDNSGNINSVGLRIERIIDLISNELWS